MQARRNPVQRVRGREGGKEGGSGHQKFRFGTISSQQRRLLLTAVAAAAEALVASSDGIIPCRLAITAR